jgi:hypothetical protein
LSNDQALIGNRTEIDERYTVSGRSLRGPRRADCDAGLPDSTGTGNRYTTVASKQFP